MPYSLCDMDCDQDINKPVLEEHCSDCLCTGGLGNLDQQDVPATKAWRPTSVVEERIRIKTLSIKAVGIQQKLCEDGRVAKYSIGVNTALGIR